MLAKKSLGQNFLTDKNKIKEIVESLELKDGDVVVEIGPGHGELTEQIVKSGMEKVKRLILIEKDEELVKDLKIKFKENKNIEIISGDILKIMPDLISHFPFPISHFKLVGNIPYYITGFLFRILGELENKPETIVLTIQKEVADRVCAEPPKNNLLAASVQYWAKTEIISYISKKDFDPIPKVDSAIIKLSPQIDVDKTQIDADKYYRFIKILFKQPRKTILNNIESGIINNVSGIMSKGEIVKKLEEAEINPKDRAQNLSINKIVELSKIFK